MRTTFAANLPENLEPDEIVVLPSSYADLHGAETADGITAIALVDLAREILRRHDETDPDRSTCRCGHPIALTPDGWQHDSAPYFWGDDHDANPN